MKKEFWISYNGNWIKNPSKWILFKRRIKYLLKRWKIVDTKKYWIVPEFERKNHFILSDKEYIEAQNIYKEKGTIAYIFYPCGGIAWGVKVRVLDTSEEIDITDINNW